MQNKKTFLKLFLLTVVLGVGVFISTTNAATITAGAPIRITPLCISAENDWYSSRYMWSSDGAKIWIKEETADRGIGRIQKPVLVNSTPMSPAFPCFHVGRGLVWGNIADLMADSINKNYANAIGSGGADAVTALTSYKALTHQMSTSYSTHVEWSRLVDQPNIAWGVYNSGSTYTLRYTNTSTDCTEAVCTTHAISGGDLGCTNGVNGCNETRAANGAANILAWTPVGEGLPQKLVMVLPKDSRLSLPAADEFWWDGFWVIDVSHAFDVGNPHVTKQFITTLPSPGETNWNKYGWFSHGHTQTSPDMQAIAYYGSTSYMSIFASDAPTYSPEQNVTFAGVHYPIVNACKYATCPEANDDTSTAGNLAIHASWFSSNDHYFAYAGYCGAAPCIVNNDIFAII